MKRQKKNSLIGKIKDRVSSWKDTLVSWFKRTFQKAEVSLAQAKIDYNTSRTALIKALGFSVGEQPTDIEILQALDASKDDPNVIEAVKAFEKATKQMNSVFENLSDELEGSIANIAFTVNAWGDIAASKDITGIQLIDQVFGLRDKRMQYIQEFQNQLENMNKQLDPLIQDSSFKDMGNAYRIYITKLVNNAKAQSLVEYDRLINAIDDQLNRIDKQLQTQKAQKQKTSPSDSGIDDTGL